MIKRYHYTVKEGCTEQDEGFWVRHEDYLRAVADKDAQLSRFNGCPSTEVLLAFLAFDDDTEEHEPETGFRQTMDWIRSVAKEV